MKFLSALLVTLCFSGRAPAQDCLSGAIYGLDNRNEKGKSMALRPDKQAFYVGGQQDDDLLLFEMDLQGGVLWARIINLAPGEEEHISSMFVDDEGMLAVAGMIGDHNQGGSIFALRFDPINKQVLWSKRYTSFPRNYSFSVVENPNNGNYILVNNPHDDAASNNDLEIVELVKATGLKSSGFIKSYSLQSSESLSDLVFHNGFAFGCGRYTEGGGVAGMRHTLVKLDPSNGDAVWTKLGHVGPLQTARLYGSDLIIHQEKIYSTYMGDPSGTSTSNTKIFVQRSDIDGNLEWLKQYELPGPNDQSYQLIQSDNGIVILAGTAETPRQIILFKVDYDGNLRWARTYSFPNIVASFINRVTSELHEVDNHLYFVGYGNNSSGRSDILIARTDLNGVPDIQCLGSSLINVPVTNISNPDFHDAYANAYDNPPAVGNRSATVTSMMVTPREYCFVDTLEHSITIDICDGQEFEGHTSEGLYTDYFTSSQGCDSARTLELSVHPMHVINTTIGICFGENYEGYTTPGFFRDTFSSVFGCDSVRNLTLSFSNPTQSEMVVICEGAEFEGHTTSGVYMDTISGLGGDCDTINTLQLFVAPTGESTLDVTICTGDIYEGYDDTGTYIDTFTNMDGCDSIRFLELLVGNEIITEEFVQICKGDSVGPYNMDGIFLDTMQSTFGCDSIHILHLQIVQPIKNLHIDLCAGGQFETYQEPGFYIDTLQGQGTPCDTIRFLTLTQSDPETTLVLSSICSGDSLFGYKEEGIYQDTFYTAAGCDSIRQLSLTVIPLAETYFEGLLCDNNIQGHNTPGLYVDTLISSSGCDSIRTILVRGEKIYIPNVFSPNQDGVNDLFILNLFPGPDLILNYFAIFDRFGDMLYETETWPIEWNGKSGNGIECNPGVFSYILIYPCGGKDNIEHGTVTLIR